MKSIECGIPIGPGALDYASVAIESGLKTSELNLTWLLCIDTLCEKNYESVLKDRFGDRIKFVNPPNLPTYFTKCGWRHGPILDTLVKNSTADYLCLHDSDIAFLRKGWDSHFYSFLNEKTIVVGMESPLHDGWRNFPTSMIFMFDRKKFNELNIRLSKTCFSGTNDWLERFPQLGPSDSRGWVTITKENSKFWGRKPGERVYLETGFEMVPAVLTAGFSSKVMKCKLKNQGNPKFETQWYFDDQDNLIASHLTRSRQRPFLNSESSFRWLSEVNDALQSNDIILSILN